MQSSLSPEKLIAYPLSPSSPLPIPHAPMRGQSSTVTPASPLSSVCSLSPAQTQLVAPINHSPLSQTSSTTTTNQDPSQVYTSEMSSTLNLFDFSPPILAESPVHLYDLLDDPDIVSVLKEHLPPTKRIAGTGSDFSLSCGSFQSSPSFYQSSMNQVGYGSTQQFHPPNYNLSPMSVTPGHRLRLSSPSDQVGLQQLQTLTPEAQQSLSHPHSSKPRAVRASFSPSNPYRPQIAVPLHASGPFADVGSPQYPLPTHNHPLAQVYMQDPTQLNYQSHSQMGILDSSFQNRPTAHPHPLLPSTTPQVATPIYHQQTSLPHSPVTTSVSSSIPYQPPKPPARLSTTLQHK